LGNFAGSEGKPKKIVLHLDAISAAARPHSCPADGLLCHEIWPGPASRASFAILQCVLRQPDDIHPDLYANIPAPPNAAAEILPNQIQEATWLSLTLSQLPPSNTLGFANDDTEPWNSLRQ
jgi:hypothetical protein